MPAMKVFNSHTPRPSTASVNPRYQQQQQQQQQQQHQKHHSQHQHQATVNLHHQQQQLQHPVNSSSYFQAPSDHTHIANINDFNHKQQVLSRVPWFDATLALSSLAKGKARGNKSALRLRAKLQEKFFELGCWIQKHPVTVLFVGTLLLVFLSVTLKSATIETNIENLWVEVGGSLEKELNYIRTTTGEGNGNTNQLLIQTPKDESANVLNADALLYHLEVLKAATDVTVDLFETTWSIRDICLTQPTPKVEEEFIQKILDHLFPCAIISPLDCFWEGSKLLSIKQPIEPPDYIRSVLPEFKWTSLNPQLLISDLKVLLREKSESSSSTTFHLEKLEKIMNRAGITTAYQERPCLNPDDSECPSSAPNKAGKNLPDIGAYLTGGCNGFATKFMHWPEDLIVGGVKKNSTGHIVKASALQTIIQLMGEKQMYEFWANNNHQVHYIDWSVDKAKQVLETWQREFSREVRRLTGTLNVNKVDTGKPFLWSWMSSILTSAFSLESSHSFSPSASDANGHSSSSFISSSPGSNSSSSGIFRNNQYTISLYTDTLLHDIMISCSSINYTSVVIMLILMATYVTFVTSNYSQPIYSHTFVAIVGLGLIILSTTAALGTCKHLHVTFNATTTRIVPFIIISFSVYILLLICKTYKDNLSVIMYYEECIIGNILKQIGPLVCLIDTCLILAFLISSIIPIPLLRSFALQCAIILVFNTITLLILLPAVMTIDIGRRKNNVLDVFCCFSNKIEPLNNLNNGNNINNNSLSGDLLDDENCKMNQQFTHPELNDDDEDEDNCFYNLNYIINKWYTPFVRQKSTKYLTIFFAIVALFSTMSGIGNVKDGLDIKDIVPRDQIEFKFLDIRDKYFSFFNIFAVTKDKFDYPNHQRLLQEYYDSFSQVSKIIKNEDGGLPDFWLNVFRSWLQRLQDAFDSDWAASYITQESWNGNASEEAILAYKLLIQTGKHDNPVDKSLVTKTRLVDSSGIINPKAFYNYLNAWVNTDEMAYAATQAEFKPEIREWTHVPSALDLKIPKAQALTYAQMPFFINRVYSTKDITTVIKEIREICAKFEEKGLPNFPTGLPFIYWEQYLRLPMNLLIGGCVITVAITLVSYIFFFHLTTVMLLMSLQLLLTFQLYALMGILEINMSAITVVILIITIGASTIFFMPITVSFLTSLGHRDSRVAISLKHMLPPTVHGCVSLTLGIGILAFSELDFIVKYFFYVFAGFIAYGFLYGTIVLPILLSLIGPESELVSLDLPDRIATPTPPPSPLLSPHRSTSPSFDIPYDEYISYRTATGRRQSPGHRNRASNKSAESLRSGKVKTLPSQYFSLREYPPVSSEISLSTIEEESRSNYHSSAEFIVQPPELVVKTTSITNVTSTPNCYLSSSCNEPPKVVIESPVPNSDSEGPESPISRDSPLSDSSSSSGYTCGMSRPNSAPGRVPNVTSSSTSYFLPKQTVTTKVTTTAKVKLYTPSVPPPQNANRSSSSSASSSSSNRNTNSRTSSFSGLNIRNSRKKPF